MLRMDQIEHSGTRAVYRDTSIGLTIMATLLVVVLGWVGFAVIEAGDDLASGAMKCGECATFGIDPDEFNAYARTIFGG